MSTYLLFLFLMLVSLPALAQNYLISGKNLDDYQNTIIRNPKLGYGYCQINQLVLLDKMIKVSKNSINSIALDIVEANEFGTDNLSMTWYTLNLYQQIMGHISLLKMKEQLKTKGLYNLISAVKGSLTKSVLQLENVSLDLEKEIILALDTSLEQNVWKRLPRTSRDYVEGKVKNQLLKVMLGYALEKTLRGEIRDQIAKHLAGNLTKVILSKAARTALFKFGKEILVSAGKGAILEVVTLPLHAYTLPPEGRYLEMVKLAPEYLINPEWTRSEDNLEPPVSIWRNHCLLMTRRPKIVELYFERALKSKKIEMAAHRSELKENRYDPNWRQLLKTSP